MVDKLDHRNCPNKVLFCMTYYMSTYNERAYRVPLHIPVQSRLHKNDNIYLKMFIKNRLN